MSKNNKVLDTVGEVCELCEVGTVELISTDRVLRYKGEEKELFGLEVTQCTECGDGFYTRASKSRVNRGFADLKRRVDGFLTSEALVAFRKEHKLTQEDLSGLLGMAPKTIARYETGFAIQSKQVDLMLRMLINTPSNLRWLSALTGVEVSGAWAEKGGRVVSCPGAFVPLRIPKEEFLQDRESFREEEKPYCRDAA